MPILRPTSSAPTASATTATSAFKVRVEDLSQKKFQKISSICVVLWKIFSILLGVFTQSEHSREYFGCSLSAEDIDQIDKIDVGSSDGLEYPWLFNRPGLSIFLTCRHASRLSGTGSIPNRAQRACQLVRSFSSVP